MDGYTLMAKMRKARRHFRLTVSEQALFAELVEVCNSDGWPDVFNCSNKELCAALLINEKTLIRARNMLITAGLIYYRSGKSRRCVSSYSFTKPFKTVVRTPVKKEDITPVVECVEVPVTEPVSSTGADTSKTVANTNIICLSTGEEKLVCDSLLVVMNRLLGDLVWLEPVCMNNRKSRTEVEDFIKVFFSELQSREDCHKTEREAKDHFSKWFSIQVNRVQKQKGGIDERGREVLRPGKRGKRYGVY